MRHFTLLAAALALSACQTSPVISTNPTQTAASTFAETRIGGTIITGLQDAAYNLDQAVAIGVLPMNDPAAMCVHSGLQAIGQDTTSPTPAAPEFQTRVSDLISGGAVLYILAEQAKNAQANGGINIPLSCEQLIGHLILTGAQTPPVSIIRALRR